jgi:hypothetical protein
MVGKCRVHVEDIHLPASQVSSHREHGSEKKSSQAGRQPPSTSHSGDRHAASQPYSQCWQKKSLQAPRQARSPAWQRTEPTAGKIEWGTRAYLHLFQQAAWQAYITTEQRPQAECSAPSREALRQARYRYRTGRQIERQQARFQAGTRCTTAWEHRHTDRNSGSRNGTQGRAEAGIWHGIVTGGSKNAIKQAPPKCNGLAGIDRAYVREKSCRTGRRRKAGVVYGQGEQQKQAHLGRKEFS